MVCAQVNSLRVGQEARGGVNEGRLGASGPH